MGGVANASPPPLTNNNYSLEYFQGPVLAPSRVTALGGAYVASAEGVEGAAVNSASPAVRDTFSTAWLDYDLALSASLLANLSNSELENAGLAERQQQNKTDGFFELSLGANVQLGTFGVTATADLEQFTLSSASSPQQLGVQVGRWKALGAVALLDGQLIVGGGIRAITLLVSPESGGALGSILTVSGIGAEAGALLMPHDQPWRIGATVRGPVIQNPFGDSGPGAVQKIDSFVLPERVEVPWEVEAGVAYQLGPRPLNPRWIDPHDEEAPIRARIEADRAERARRRADALERVAPNEREALRAREEREEKAARALEDQYLDAESRRLRAERKARYANWPREKILILASVLVTGPSGSANTVSLEGFLLQTNEQVGQSATLTPRVGIEAEPINNLLRARVGSYLEPSRYADGIARQHFTFGGDVKLFPTDLWGIIVPTVLSLGVYADLAPRYTNGGIALGVWH